MTTAGRVVRFTDTAHAGKPSEDHIATRFPGAHVDVQPMTLREIFVVLARQTRAHAEGAAS